MEVERIEEGGRLRLALRGELDLYAAPQFDDALVEAEGESWPLLVLDLSGLEFMDSAGLRLIVRTHARAEQAGRRMVVVNGPDTVARVFTVTSLDRQLEIVDDLGAAPDGA
jgi:anti-sigma B factor antagonist